MENHVRKSGNFGGIEWLFEGDIKEMVHNIILELNDDFTEDDVCKTICNEMLKHFNDIPEVTAAEIIGDILDDVWMEIYDRIEMKMGDW